jgi:hypothetical protein
MNGETLLLLILQSASRETQNQLRMFMSWKMILTMMAMTVWGKTTSQNKLKRILTEFCGEKAEPGFKEAKHSSICLFARLSQCLNGILLCSIFD